MSSIFLISICFLPVLLPTKYVIIGIHLFNSATTNYFINQLNESLICVNLFSITIPREYMLFIYFGENPMYLNTCLRDFPRFGIVWLFLPLRTRKKSKVRQKDKKQKKRLATVMQPEIINTDFNWRSSDVFPD